MVRPGSVTDWSFAVPDWEERLAAGRSLLPDLPLDAAEAERAVKMFNLLKIPDVIGTPSMEVASGEWLRDIVRALFGSMVGGERMVPEIFAMVPKKNSKTTGGAAISLTALNMNKRPRAQFIYVGPTQEIAELAFDQAVGMIKEDPYLEKRYHIADHLKKITDRRNKSTLKIKTFDMKVMTGAKPVFVLLDELHMMAGINGAGRVIGQIRGGMIANPDSIFVIITTQSDIPPHGVFKTELEFARRVRDGKIAKSRMLPMLYEFSEKMQKSELWRDPKYWPQVLPNLNRSIRLQRLVDDYRESEEKGEEEFRRWCSQHLNIQIGLGTHDERWNGVDYWDAATEPGLKDLDEFLARCEVAVVGGDGGGLDDLFGGCVIGREKETRRWLVWCKVWAHSVVLKRRKEIAEQLKDFAAQGDLVFCETPTQDIDEFVQICMKVRDSGLLPEKGGIGIDKLGLPALLDALVEAGFEIDANGGTITGIGQGGYLNDAIIGCERKLSDGTMVHAGQPILGWACANAKVELKGSARSVTKAAAGKAKIDPMIAMFNAAKLMSRNPAATPAKKFQLMVFG